MSSEKEERPLEPTILVVDDDQSAIAVTTEMLTRCGMSVLAAMDGAEGLKVFEENQGAVDLVVLDLIMPRMGGEEALRELRRIDSRVPVLISSGLGEEKLADQFSKAKRLGFIQKPFSLKILREKISALLGDR